MTERKWNVHYGGLAWGRTDGDFYFHAGRRSPLYTAADRKAWNDGSTFTMKTMWPQLANVTFNDLNKLDIPVMLFLARHDYTTPSSIAATWMERLTAPSKTIVWFENSAHLPMIEEPGHVLGALLEHVRPLAGKGEAARK